MIQFLLIFIVFDQLVLPMFHIGTIPIKPSYVIIVMLLILKTPAIKDRVAGKYINDAKKRGIMWFGGILVSCILGQLMFDATHGFHKLSVADYIEIIRSLAIYLLMLLSFLVGIKYQGFKADRIIYVCIGYSIMHFAVTYLGNSLPIINNLYLSAEDRGSLETYDTVTGVLGMGKNPNSSMLLLNMALLGMYLSYKWEKGKPHALAIYLAIILVGGFICLQLGSRSETGTFVCITAAFLFEFFKKTGSKGFIQFGAGFLVLFLISVSVKDGQLINDVLGSSRLYRRTFEKGIDVEVYKERPVRSFNQAFDRFKKGPIIGTGFVTENVYPFWQRPKSYHNDWYRVFVTGGLVSGICMLLILFKLSMKSGVVMIAPFLFTSFTNTFLLNIPAVIVYFFYTGVFYPSIANKSGDIKKRTMDYRKLKNRNKL